MNKLALGIGDPEWAELVEDLGGSSLRHLTSPPESVPVVIGTTLQVLPFGSLTWPDFERLCYRLCRLDGEVESCLFYGVAGQSQAGIDILLRRRDGGYSVVQCKRHASFTADKLEKAVDKFLDGRWAEDADSLTLATSTELASIADAVSTQTDRLSAKGISFIPWDASALSDELKKSPDLVLDFFGRAAVELFFDQSVATQLVERLDSVGLREYRRQLGDLYRQVVAVQDPGIVTEHASTPLHLRFVMPDVVLEDERSTTGIADGRPSDVRATLAEFDHDLESSPSVDEVQLIPTGVEARISAEHWLATGNRKLAVGEPGAGKSALLRFVLLDIFEPEPRSEVIARRWGDSIPLWLPFGFWTHRARQRGESIGLEECVRLWLEHWSRADLWPLVKRAIADRRLVLLVDGLDEWATQPLGAQAVQQLLVYAEHRGCPVIATSRPFGVQSLPLAAGSWELGRIAPLSDEQRYEMVDRWLDSSRSNEAATPEETLAETLIGEIEASERIRRLSRNPLLLSILLYLRSVHDEVPRDWATVMNRVVGHLLGRHRSQKLLEAASGDQIRHSHEVRRLVVILAAAVQERGEADALTYADALGVLVGALSDESDLSLGYARSDAAALARDLLDSVSTGLGILVLPGDDAIGFVHRYIQEYLCAEHLLVSAAESRQSTIIDNLDDPRWREVIALCLQQVSDQDEIRSLFGAFEAMGPIVGEIVDTLAGAVSFAGSDELDIGFREQLAERVFDRIELGERTHHRLQLLGHVPDALRSPIRESTLRRLDRWIWSTRKYPNVDDFAALSSWPVDDLTERTLWTGVLSDHRLVQRVCAGVLGDLHSAENDELRDRLIELARSSDLVGRRSAAIEALGRGWPSVPELDELVGDALASRSPELVASAVAADLRRGNVTDNNRDLLLDLAKLDRHDLVWPLLAGDLLVEHFPQDPTVMETYLRAVRDPQGRTSVGIPPAVSVLLRAYTRDPAIRAWVIDEIRTAEYPFIIGEEWPWELVAAAYRDDIDVVAAVEEWALRDSSGAGDVQLSAAARVGRSPRLRGRLLQSLRESSAPSWACSALLSTYDDGEVQEALRALALADVPIRSQQIAELIPDIVGVEEALPRLLTLASTPEVTRLDRVAYGLASLVERGDATLDREIEDAVSHIVRQEIAERTETGGVRRTSAESALFTHFAALTSVQQLALSRLGKQGVPVNTLVYGFRGDADMRAAVAANLFPLPASLRARLVQVLTDVPLSDTAITVRLDSFDADADGTVKILGAVAAATRARRTARASELVDRFTAMASSVGHDHDERRCAGFAGLATIGTLNRLVELREPFRLDDLVTIPSPLATQGGPFFRVLGESWAAIRETFGDTAESRLSRFEPKSLWQGLMAVAADYPALRADALHRVNTEPATPRGGDLDSWSQSIAETRFLARVEPASERVYERCVQIVEAGGGPSYAEQRPFWEALEVLSVQFRTDTRIAGWLGAHLDEELGRLEEQAEMLGARRVRYVDPVVIAACRLRPNDVRLEQIASSVTLNEGLSFDEVELCFATFDASAYSDLVDRVASGLSWSGWFPDLLVRPAIGRLMIDPQLAAELRRGLDPSDGTSRGTLARLLAASGHLDDRLSRFIRSRRQHLMTRPARSVSYDPVVGEVRGEDLILRDINS